MVQVPEGRPLNTQLTSILFLAIIIIVPLGMIAGLITLLVRRVRGRSQLGSIEKLPGWQSSSPEDTNSPGLRALLEPTLFAMRTGRHELKPMLSGRFRGIPCWIAEYHYQSLHSRPRMRRGGVYSLLVMKRRTDARALPGDATPRSGTSQPGLALQVQHRQQGALASIAEHAAGGSLVPGPGDEWSWALVSSTEALARIPRQPGLGQALKSLTLPGDAVFIFGEIVVWSRRMGVTEKWVARVPEMAALLAGLHAQK